VNLNTSLGLKKAPILAKIALAKMVTDGFLTFAGSTYTVA
jgi:hypothetical protein